MELNYLLSMYEKYKNAEKILKKYFTKEPKENIHVSKTGKYKQYLVYFSDNGIKSRKYIKKKNVKTISKLAQKKYNNQLYKFIKNRIKVLEKIKEIGEFDLDIVYKSFDINLKEYITPIVETWDDRVIDWKKEEYYIRNNKSGDSDLITKNGEYVRSKSEKIIADMLYDNNIVYKYESPLYIENKTFYPDFTFLSRKTGREIYWEHFGLIDDYEYRKSMVKKLQYYSKEGILTNKNLIITFETNGLNFDTNYFEKIIDELKKEVL